MFKKDTLRAAITFTKRVNHIEGRVCVRDCDDQVLATHALKPVCQGHALKNLACFLFHVIRLTEARVLL